MSFKTQIEDLIGSVGDDALITQSLLDAGTEIIHVAPKNKLINSSYESSVSTSGLAIDGKKILEVHKDQYVAKRVPYSDIGKYKDSGSIYYANTTDPIYYTKDEKVYIVTAGSLTTGFLVYVPKQPTTDGSTLIAHGDSATQFFPLEAEHLMVLGAAVKCLQRLLANATTSLPSDISGSLTFAGPPDAPSLSDTSISFSATVPVYTAPTVAGETEELTAALSNDATADNNKLDFSDWFEVAGDFIQTEEDIELAGSQLQKISTYLNAYSQAMQNKLNIFNDANVEYQAELQKAIQNAQLASTDDAQKIQKYQAGIQDYSAQVNKAIQERNSDIQNFNAKLQKQITDYQWKQSQLQSLKAEYNEGLQLLIGVKRT
tara:strand:+ start:503 stop:1624 length:1122 start_codon:yes stop_codon:yes gene_type:complete